MDGVALPQLLRLLTFALSITLALACVAVGVQALRMTRMNEAPVPVRRTRTRLSALALVTSVGWGWLAQQQIPALELWNLAQLPPPAAGLRAPSDSMPVPAQVAARVSEIESALLDRHNPRFVRVRDQLTSLLIQNPRFSQADTAIHIDLTRQPDADFIRYLVEEKPGMLTVIYYVQQDGHKRMLVYWPEVTGGMLIYTPITGPGVAALSSWLIEKADAPVARMSGSEG